MTLAAEAVFRAVGLTKVYRMGDVDVEALAGVDLDLYRAEIVVILGPSGSGKSTLLNILGGLDVPTSGTVRFLEHDLTSQDDEALTRYRREHVGFVFQFFNLVPSLTARENVELVTEIADRPMEASEALKLVGLGGRLDHFPAQMSGGEQQRVAIARAIAKRPDVLLCDEPTGALDFETGKLVLEVLDRVNRELGTTVALITNNAGIAAMADRVVRMRSESLAAAGQLAAEDLDRARTDERTARQSIEAAAFRVEATRHVAESARAALIESGTGATITLYAPARRRVLRLREDSERVVPAGAPILEIGDPSRLEVVVDVLSTDAVGIPAGAPMRLDAGSGRVFDGRVRRIEPSAFTKVSPLGVEEQRVNVIGDFDGPTPGLADGFRVEASVVLWSSGDVLKAPAGAVFRSGGGWAAFVIDGNRARRRDVTVGHRNPDDVEIIDGLAAGDTVVVHPGDDVADGVRVRTLR